MVDDLIQKTIEPCKAALKDAGLTAAQIDEVVLVGGQTRIRRSRSRTDVLRTELNKGVEPRRGGRRWRRCPGRRVAGDVKDVRCSTSRLVARYRDGGRRDDQLIIVVRRSRRKSDTFSTDDDDQTGVTIGVMQAERESRSTTSFSASSSFRHSPAPRGVRRSK